MLRHLPRHPWQAGLALLGVALGVAVAVSIDLANASATRAFEISTTRLAGRATHTIEAPAGGLPDRLFAEIVGTPGPVRAAPVVEGVGAAFTGDPEHATTLRILGLDPFSERPFRPGLAAVSRDADSALTELITRPGTGLSTPETATELGVEVGGRFTLRVSGLDHEVELLARIDPDDEGSRDAFAGLLVMDVASAQEVLGKVGRLDRIDLVLPGEDPDRAAVLDRLRPLLPPGAEIRPAGAGAGAFAEMTRAFRLNLTALSLLALICGAFLIYNTMTFSVVQRRHLIGTLRAMGVTRRELLGALLLEAAILGTAGSLLGLALGVALGESLVDLVTRTINDLYLVLSVRELAVDPRLLAKGALLGVGATLAAALAPALEATTATPRSVLARSELESRARGSVLRAALAGLFLLSAGGLLLARMDPAGPGGGGADGLAAPFLGLFVVIVGCALLAPGATVVLMAALRRPAGLLFGVLGRMAARDVVASLSRTGVAVAALVIAVSVTVGIGVMIGSFRAAVVDWLGHTLGADVYLSPAGPDDPPGARRLAPAALRRIAATPGVAGLDPIRTAETGWRPGTVAGDRNGGAAPETVRLVALDLAETAPERYRLTEGGESDRRAAFARAARGEAVLVSEPLAYRHRLAPGDPLRLDTPRGSRTLPVAGVYRDYGSQEGAVLIDLALYRRLYRDPALSGIAVRAAPGVDAGELAARLRRETAAVQALDVRSRRALRERSLAIFDRTFEITRVLRWLAGLVAFIGVLSALMALQLERARELGVLRANGLTPGQLWQLVTSQTALLGLAAGLLALPVGLVLAAVMIRVINRRSFGWTMEMSVDPAILAQAVALAVAASLLAGLYPAWKMSRTSPAEALREE